MFAIESLDQATVDGTFIQGVSDRHAYPGDTLDKHPGRADLNHQRAHQDELGDITHVA